MEPLDPELRRIIHDGMVQAVPEPAVQERVLEGLLRRIGDVGPTPDGGGEAGPGGGVTEAIEPVAAAAGSGKAMLAVALGGSVLLAAAWIGGGRREAPRKPAPAPSAAMEPAASPSSEPEPRFGPPEPMEQQPAAAPSSVELAPREREPTPGSETRASVPRTKRQAPAPDALAAEIRVLEAAERALEAGDARRALAHAREHATAHPMGQLTLERTAIELSARCRLGEDGAVEAASAFVREHGTAPVAAKVRARCLGAEKSTEQ